jgi:PPM family protein phosphatase
LADPLVSRIARLVTPRGARELQSIQDYVVATSVGSVRKENQDAALLVIARHADSSSSDFDAAVLCDGLGGMKEGGEAARLGVSCFASRILRTSRLPLVERVRSAISHANAEIFNKLRGEGGTTLSAVLLDRSGSAIVGHVGDSRIYSVAKGALRQLTRDDTMQAVLNRPAKEHVRDSRLLQFVGMGQDLDPQILSVRPESRGFMLTSDGVHDIPFELISQTVSREENNADLCRKLIQISELLGGKDNSTVVMIPPTLLRIEDAPFEKLEIKLLSPSRSLDVWITNFVETKHVASQEAPKPDSKPPSGDTGAKPDKDRAKLVRKRKRPRKKNKVENEDQLPLPSEAVEIQFPDPEEND